MQSIVRLLSAFTLFACGSPAANTGNTNNTAVSGNTFTIQSYGTFNSPTDQGGPVTQVTDKLQFAYVGSKGTAKADSGGGNIWFPMGATTGTYNVKVATNGSGLSANEVALDMTGGVEDKGVRNVAQSGTVSLTVDGAKYTVAFKDLPSLDGSNRADVISGQFTW